MGINYTVGETTVFALGRTWSKTSKILLFSGVGLYTILLGWASLMRHWNLESQEDLAMFDQMLWSVRQGHGLICSVSGVGILQFPHHFFGEHVSPILYLLAWPAGLTPGPEALLIFQALGLALAALPLYRLAHLLTGSRRMAICTAFGWLLQPALWGAALYDFHMEAFEGLFLFSFAVALLSNRWSALLWAVLYASCKEDAPIYLAAVAFFLGWEFHRWRIGLLVAVGAAFYALAAVLWIGPALSPTGQHLLAGRMLTFANSGGLWGWIRTVLLHPDRWLALAGHLLAVGLLPILGGWLIVPVAMAVGVMWLSRTPVQALLLLHYPLTIYPLLFLAALGGLSQITRLIRHNRYPIRIRLVMTGVIILTVLGLFWGWTNQSAAIGSIGFRRDMHAGRVVSRCLREAVTALPPDQSITVLPNLIAHVARRQKLFLLDGYRDADWLVLKIEGQDYPFNPVSYHKWLNKLLDKNSSYGAYALIGGQVVILRRGYSHELNEMVHRCDRSLKTVDLPHRIGHHVVDYAAQIGIAWEASRYERQDWVMLGPYLNFPAGRYHVGFRVKAEKIWPSNPITFDVVQDHGRTVLGKVVLDRPTHGYEWLSLDVMISGDDVEFRCWKSGYGNIRLDTVRWQRVDLSKIP